jgi:hypothetical protein
MHYVTQSQSNTADITSPIKDSIFQDDELPMSKEQAEKVEREMRMKNAILRCYNSSLEAEKFQSAMKSKISTFEPYPDDDNLKVLRETSEDIGIRCVKKLRFFLYLGICIVESESGKSWSN